jgi:hypothetical protein
MSRTRYQHEPGLARKEGERRFMMRNVMRGILGLILAAAATWLANWITEQIFGPEEEFAE